MKLDEVFSKEQEQDKYETVIAQIQGMEGPEWWVRNLTQFRTIEGLETIEFADLDAAHLYDTVYKNFIKENIGMLERFVPNREYISFQAFTKVIDEARPHIENWKQKAITLSKVYKTFYTKYKPFLLHWSQVIMQDEYTLVNKVQTDYEKWKRKQKGLMKLKIWWFDNKAKR